MSQIDIDALLAIVKRKNRLDQHRDWSNRSEIYFEEIGKEVAEAAVEAESGRACYLEDELGDILWDYLNLLQSLQNEGKISLTAVFQRSLAKYDERVSGLENGEAWADIKERQKVRLAEEQAIRDRES